MKLFRQSYFLLASAIACALSLTACLRGGESYPVPGSAGAAAAADAPASAALPYYGVIDRRDCDTVGGWVMHSTDPEADIKVELYVDGELVEAMPARTLRPDLSSKVGTGRYGFGFKIPPAYKDGRPHLASVKVAGSDYAVPFFEGVFSTFECQP